MLDMFMEMRFGTQKYCQVFIVSTGYRRLTMFIRQYVTFPTEQYNFGFTNAEFHVAKSAPTPYRINSRVQQISIPR
jgi:hypothetical protein